MIPQVQLIPINTRSEDNFLWYGYLVWKKECGEVGVWGRCKR